MRLLLIAAVTLLLAGCASVATVPDDWASSCPCLYGRPAPTEYLMRCEG